MPPPPKVLGTYDCSRSGRDARWYSAGVQHEVWARLTSPFPPEALAWIVAEIEPGGDRARLEPAWFPDAVRRRLDTELGLEGWSFALSRSEEHTSELQSRPHLVCRLLLEKKKKNKEL